MTEPIISSAQQRTVIRLRSEATRAARRHRALASYMALPAWQIVCGCVMAPALLAAGVVRNNAAAIAYGLIMVGGVVTTIRAREAIRQAAEIAMLDDSKPTGRLWRKERINPIEYLAARDIRLSWLEFDPTICKGVTPRTLRIGINGGGDGTLLFVRDDIEEVLDHVLLRRPFFSGDPPRSMGGSDPEKTLDRLRYRLGWLRIAMTFPPEGVRLRVDPARRYPGMRSRVSLCYQPGFGEVAR